jgi:hypothetical protein
MNMTVTELREFVSISPWQFARTMPEMPHEYTLRAKAPDEKTFERVVLYIRQVGYKAEFGSATVIVTETKRGQLRWRTLRFL